MIHKYIIIFILISLTPTFAQTQEPSRSIDIIVLLILVAIFLGLAYLNRQYSLVGMSAGFGLIMLALVVQLGGIEHQVGYVKISETNLENVTYKYINLSETVAGFEIFQVVFVIALASAGLFIFIDSFRSSG